MADRPDLPRGTVTFLFTDIEGSTALWERDQVAMRLAVDRHLELLDAAIAVHGGYRGVKQFEMAVYGVTHHRLVPLPERGAPLDVGEEEGNRS